jgi:hypothetical protein
MSYGELQRNWEAYLRRAAPQEQPAAKSVRGAGL